MIKSTVLLATLSIFPLINNATVFKNTEKELAEKLNKQAICFTENKGQVHDQNYKPRPDVLYGVMAGNMAVHIKNNGVSYQLDKVDAWKEVTNEKTKEKHKEIDKHTIYRVDLNWINANNNFTETQDESLPGYSNYYLENCPNGALNVKSYKGITLHNLYNGINLHYYEKNGELKHDYIVAPNNDYKQIQLKIEGAGVTLNKDGSLFLTTPLGKIMEGAPVVYQEGKLLKAKWNVSNNVLSFEIENYNPAKELIIDPITRLWGTYYGGTADDFVNSCATDGNVYLAGYTASNTGTIIATVGSHQSTHNGGVNDAFLAKFNTLGARQWATYYGGAADDKGNSCTIDPLSNIYLAGTTASNTGTVIATIGSQQAVFGGGTNDAFLVKFDVSGVRQWSTYYGGTGNETGSSCVADAAGVFLSGQTTSNTSTVIATIGSHQPANGGGNDAFLVKFSSAGVRQWGTYYGGTGTEAGLSCSISGLVVYLAGITTSTTSIASVGAHQQTYGGTLPFYDAFLVGFSTMSGVRQWGTYYGGSSNEFGYSCVTDASGNVFLAGETSSTTGTVIATPGSHQSTNGGGNDAFIVKFNSAGVRQWGTYYGGTGNETGGYSFVDPSGNVYLAGQTNSNTGNVIATVGSYQSVNGGGNDAYFVKFNSAGIRQSGTYYGGAGNESAPSGVTDLSGNIFLAGSTTSSTSVVIATASSHQPVLGGNTDGFLVKFMDCIGSLSPTASVNATVCAGSSLNFTANITGTANPTYSWIGPNSYTSNIQNPSFIASGNVNIGIYTLTVNNGGCVETATTQVNIVNPQPTITAISNPSVLCNGLSANLSATGALNYTWSPSVSLSFPNGALTPANPTVTTTYSVFGKDINGCTNTGVTTISVTNCSFCWKEIDGGFSTTFGIKNDGTLWSWGRHGNALGAGTTTSSPVPIKISTATNWSKVVSRIYFTSAIKSDGTLWGWGVNSTGQLGNGTTTSTNVPTQIGTSNNWKSVAVGSDFVIGLKNDGTIWAWGDNSVGQLGISIATSNTFIPTQVDTCTHWKQIAAGNQHAIGLKTDGTLWGWGNNAFGQVASGIGSYTDTPVQIGSGTNWQAVFQSEDNSIAIRNDGTLWTWGSNSQGESGLGSVSAAGVPTQVGTANNWISFKTEWDHSLGQKADGSIWACGNNFSGVYGNGTTMTSTNTPIQVVNPNWTTIGLGLNHCAGIKYDGSLWTWGRNLNGQLGDGTTNDSSIPLSISCPTSTTVMDENQNLTSIFTIYPNPVHETLHINIGSLDPSITNIEVVDIIGKLVIATKAISNDFELRLPQLANGMYVVKVLVDNKEIINKKLIKN